MTIDGSINIGNLLQIIIMLGGGIYFLYSIKTEMAVMGNIQKNFSDKLTRVDLQLEELARVIIEMAKQGERMLAQDVRMQELSNRLDFYIKSSQSSQSSQSSSSRRSKN